MSDNTIFIAENIAIVPAQSSVNLEPSMISTEELSGYHGTVSLHVADSASIDETQFTSIKLLFGSWVESGDEDKHLEELYKSRLVPSTLPDE